MEGIGSGVEGVYGGHWEWCGGDGRCVRKGLGGCEEGVGGRV